MKRPPPAPPALRSLPPVKRNGTPLVTHLADSLKLSRRAAKGLLDERLVFVNSRRIWMAKHLLQIRDVVEILPDALKVRDPKIPIPVLIDDPLFCVVNKPARLLSTGERSLETRLREQLDIPELRAVHRLDKDTSGCLLLAKTPEARRTLVKQFEEGRIRKLYHALVSGNLPSKTMDIRMQVDNLPAVSHVRQVSEQTKHPRCAHVTVAIETGRTHQIRVHLHHIGDPILGDRQYFSSRCNDFQEVPRQMLHASELRFFHPITDKPITGATSLPKDFRAWMRTLQLD